MSLPALTYLIATRNKLSFLQETLPLLLAQVQSDEEVVVVDGASTDGTREYLRDQYERGLIHRLISEPDRGEAHALNKGLLSARGQLIKVMSDDDVYFWPAIQKAKRFLLNRPEVDALGSEGADTNWANEPSICPTSHRVDFEAWSTGGRPFMFCGLSLILRRESLPLVGLFHTGVLSVDDEFCRRLTTLPIRLVWYTAPTYVRICNPHSNSILYNDRYMSEFARIVAFYEGPPPKQSPVKMAWRGFKAAVRPARMAARRMMYGPSLTKEEKLANLSRLPASFCEVRSRCYAWLDEQNRSHSAEFLFHDRSACS